VVRPTGKSPEGVRISGRSFTVVWKSGKWDKTGDENARARSLSSFLLVNVSSCEWPCCEWPCCEWFCCKRTVVWQLLLKEGVPIWWLRLRESYGVGGVGRTSLKGL
jgi:hypothetical protein